MCIFRKKDTGLSKEVIEQIKKIAEQNSKYITKDTRKELLKSIRKHKIKI